MTLRRDVENRIALFGDLSSILGAMRSFALAELHRVGSRESAQHALLDSLAETLDSVASLLPAPAPPHADVWLLFGSTRGFCGSFNEDVMHAWQNAGAPQPAIVLGERLASLVPPGVGPNPVPGAEGSADAARTIGSLLAALREARARAGEDSGIVVCLREESEVRIHRLLPLPPPAKAAGPVPMAYEAPLAVALAVAEHYLFHRLLALLLRAIRVENRMRLVQMENALRHLEQGGEDLLRQRNRLRQEEIIEEIELTTRGKSGMH